MDKIDHLIAQSARALCAVAPVLPQHARLQQEMEDATRAAERGYFLPDEDERVRGAFARYLGVRAALHETIRDLEPVYKSGSLMPDEQRLRVFAVAFCAACMLMRSARFLVDSYAGSKTIWRKLDEAEPRYGLPRKQFSQIYSSATQPFNVWRFYRAVAFAQSHADAIRALASEPDIAPVIQLLQEEQHEALRISKRAEAKYRLRYFWHSMNRRRNSTLSQILFALFEGSGRAISEMQNPFHQKRVSPDVIREVRRLLRPGDAIVTRHDDAVSNLFLPGYWPHAALYIGSTEERRAIGMEMDAGRWQRGCNPARVLEARKDGVRFRRLTDTLHVDAFTVVRPKLEPASVACALSRAAEHEGKFYDFEFDFRRSDRLVCTELVYRGFHAVGGLKFHLTARAGRPTFSAEDLLDLAVHGNGYEVVALYGEHRNNRLLTGQTARDHLAVTYQSAAAAASGIITIP
ncbi:MAG: hypothetical protein ACI9R3_000192 [Verrucomicrobiales bacterium]